MTRDIELELENAARELAERYEEINLLYTISEILGRTVTLEETAFTILTEICETVGARKASILVYEQATSSLNVVAALTGSKDRNNIGNNINATQQIRVDDTSSVSSRVFRTQHPLIVPAGEMACKVEEPFREGEMLSVPIMWTGTDGPEPLGVVNLSGRVKNQPFTAGDQKLVAAIATQIGTAIQNARLVRASIEQQRLLQEMQLAHDLQMKLLPRTDIVAPDAEVAARIVPAESVGGDFYQLFKLGRGTTGVMIGDVSGHGYQAALIMALIMSASAIHAQSTSDPSETLQALLGSIRDELSTTEMFVSAFYAVLDRNRKQLLYANAGHPHAFVVTTDGAYQRLPANDPPLGMTDRPPAGSARAWSSDDLLVLFTDGISDARNIHGERLGEEPVLSVVAKHNALPTNKIVEKVFEVVDRHCGEVTLRDDLTLVVVRS